MDRSLRTEILGAYFICMEEKSRTKETLRLFWRASLHYPRATFFVLVGVITAHGLSLITPWFLKHLVDLLSQGIDFTAKESLMTAVGLIIGIDLLQQLCWRSVGFGLVYMQPRVMADLTDEAFRKTLPQSHNFFVNTFAGSLVRKINRLSNSFEDISDQAVFAIIPLVITIVGSIIGVSLRSPLIALLVATWIIAFVGAQYWFSIWKQPFEKDRALADTEATGALADAIMNASTIRLFTGSLFEITRLRSALNHARATLQKAWQLNEYAFGIQAFSMAVIWGVVLWVAVSQWRNGLLTVGDFILLYTYLNGLFHQLWDVSRVFRRFYTAMANAAEIVEIMETTPEVLDKHAAKPLTIKDASITFQNIEFRYNQTRSVLSDFNLDIAPAERVALIGPSGAGKTTVTHLLLRLYDVTNGKILIDGTNIANVTQDSLRAAIAYVPQDPVLFHRSLVENIRYGRRDASDEEVIDAAKRSRCHDFIVELPQGYETFVGERGVKLSGGERQRVAIARAILKNAPILVLDEATSSLDSESESLIQAALHELMQGKTAIVIAHRLSTIMEMDRIVVVEQGQVVDTGTHAELVKKTGTYKKLWEIQAGGFLPADEDQQPIITELVETS